MGCTHTRAHLLMLVRIIAALVVLHLKHQGLAGNTVLLQILLVYRPQLQIH